MKRLIVAASLAVTFLFGGAMSQSALAASKGKIVAFYPGSTDTYVGGVIKALKEEAKGMDYDVEVIENGYFNQQNQDQQVQQYLALGEKPSIFLWWPAEQVAGIASLRALANTGTPVIMINTQPTPETKAYLVGHEGPDDVTRATNAATMLIEARDKVLKGAGATLHSEGGNAVALTYPSSFGPTSVSLDAFKKGIEGSGIQLIAVSDEGFGAANGYTGMSKLIAQHRTAGIDLVYAMDDQILQGAVKALQEAGYAINKDVVIVGTVCHGDRRLLDEGIQYATTLQSPVLDAQLSMKVVDEYLTTGKLQNYLNFFPNPAVRWNEWKNTKLTDYHGVERTMDELCPWK